MYTSTPPAPSLRLAAALAAATLLTASGCRVTENDSLAIADGIYTSTFQTDRVGLDPTRRATEPPQPLPLDRSDWAETVVNIPSGGIKHRPTLATNFRQRTLDERVNYPTLLSAVDEQYSDLRDVEAPGQVMTTLLDFAMLIPRGFFLQPPTTLHQSPAEPYQRSRRESWLSEALGPTVARRGERTAPTTEPATETGLVKRRIPLPAPEAPPAAQPEDQPDTQPDSANTEGVDR